MSVIIFVVVVVLPLLNRPRLLTLVWLVFTQGWKATAGVSRCDIWTTIAIVLKFVSAERVTV